MLAFRTAKYKLDLTKKEKDKIRNIIKCVYIVRTRYLDDIKNGKVSLNDKCTLILEQYKKEIDEIKNCEIPPLLNSMFEIMDLLNRNIKINKITNQQRFRCSNFNNIISIYNNNIRLPSIGYLKLNYYRKIPKDSRIIKVDICRNGKNEYYAHVYYEIKINNDNELSIEKSVGIDYSQNYLIVTSDGYKDIGNSLNKEFKDRLKKLRSALSKTENKEERIQIIKKIKRINEKEKNKRRDKLHKLSTDLVNKYDYIAIEDLNMKAIAFEKNLSKKVYDNAFGILRSYLEYKTQDKGKKLIIIEKQFPSSKMCSNCGYIYNELKLDEREWQCPECHKIHDRDINAAINIRNEGLLKVKEM